MPIPAIDDPFVSVLLVPEDGPCNEQLVFAQTQQMQMLNDRILGTHVLSSTLQGAYRRLLVVDGKELTNGKLYTIKVCMLCTSLF